MSERHLSHTGNIAVTVATHSNATMTANHNKNTK